MSYNLAGYAVHKAMYDEALKLKRQGAKVSLLIPEEHASGCKNCYGDGTMRLEVVVGGPYPMAQSEVPMGGDHAHKARNIKTATYIDGKWYKRVILSFACPVCGVSTKRVTDAGIEESEGRLGKMSSVDEVIERLKW